MQYLLIGWIGNRKPKAEFRNQKFVPKVKYGGEGVIT